MTTNRLAKPATSIPHERNPLTNADVARQWARFARDQGHHDKAAAWAKHATELERQNAETRPVDGKMRAAGE